ncbi:hypothetical protein F3J37_01650 [Pantoea sp. Al-1710]|uniref:Uncharacterized protein n=1 Tax=Candidatus Pantoea communis TaxID=2608354 RepID=A0ABX0RK15_9GAMM|nr:MULTISPECIES: M91 family zinc metallopeptidase [Pantoea]NIG12916.1 hypothetical protein [Pantoea sp. Cy-640]NIG17383.1 hypothetical protein [Pantoea communis]
MRIIEQATSAYCIKINAPNVDAYNDVNLALYRIKHTNAGRSLLNKIEKYSKNGKEVEIMYRTITDLTHTVPTLTPKQAEKLQLHPTPFHQMSVSRAAQFARQGRLSKGDGASAVIMLNPFSQNLDNPHGNPHFNAPGNENYDSSLSHQLVRAMHIVRGSSLDDNSIEGREREMERAMGVREFEGEAISENMIRMELGLPVRASYPVGFSS